MDTLCIYRMALITVLTAHVDLNSSTEIDEDPPDLVSEDWLTFQSLSGLLEQCNAEHVHAQNVSAFLRQSMQNNTCSVEELCSRYPHAFKSNEKHQLTSIKLDNRFRMDHLDLMMVPNTVKYLLMRLTKLRTISKWTDLKEKSLKTLDVCQQNDDLVLDLNELDYPQTDIPLKELVVTKAQLTPFFKLEGKWMDHPSYLTLIFGYQGGFMKHLSHRKMMEWFGTSSLDKVTVMWSFRTKRTHTIFQRKYLKSCDDDNSESDDEEQIVYPPVSNLRSRYYKDDVSTNQDVFLSLYELIQSVQYKDLYITKLESFLFQSICIDQRCSVGDLCRNYPQTFKCSDDGRLITLLLDEKFSMKHLNLLMIPNTVENLQMKSTNLKSISKWKGLKGKSLKRMDVYLGNADLKVNLKEFENPTSDLPLKELILSKVHIMSYFTAIGRSWTQHLKINIVLLD